MTGTPAGADDDLTNPTLLGRLKQTPADPEAWQQFLDRYRPRIVDWCRRWGLQPADAEDVTQTVMLRLSRTMQRFEYKPPLRFRAWLKTVVHNAWKDFMAAPRLRIDSGAEAQTSLYSLAARDDLSQMLVESWRQEIVDEAFHRVRLRVQDDTWRAFAMTQVEGLSVEEAAQRLNRSLTMVYKSRSNVIRMLREEVDLLEDPDE